jgi:hypothetical protein
MGRAQGDSVVGVYMLHNRETGEAYIGSGILNERRNTHFSRLRHNTHHNHRLQAAYNRNPNFDFIGVPVEGEDRKEVRVEALNIEASLVDENARNPLLLNLMRNITEDNTFLGHSEESNEKNRQATQERWQNPAWREQVIAAQHAGRAALTDEEKERHRLAMSEAQKERYAQLECSPTKGQTRSEEFRQNNSSNIAELWNDPEYRASQMASRPKGKRNDNGLSVAVEVDGVVYPTKTAAANAHGITKQGVAHRLTSDKFPNWTTA